MKNAFFYGELEEECTWRSHSGARRNRMLGWYAYYKRQCTVPGGVAGFIFPTFLLNSGYSSR